MMHLRQNQVDGPTPIQLCHGVHAPRSVVITRKFELRTIISTGSTNLVSW
jgi:hypothetical protein